MIHARKICASICLALLCLAYGPLHADQEHVWKRHVVAEGIHNTTAVVVDFTGDNQVDVITNTDGKTLLFAAPDWKPTVIDAGTPPRSCIHSATMDVNGDGRPDFIGACYSAPALVFWLENPKESGEAPWSYHLIDDRLDGIHGLIVGDLDNDGDQDAVTCAKDDRIAAWFENDGRGRFTTHVIATGQSAYDIRLADMNGNGSLDVLIAGQESRNVIWFENPVVATEPVELGQTRQLFIDNKPHGGGGP